MTAADKAFANPWPGQVLRRATALDGYDDPDGADERAVTGEIEQATIVTSEIHGDPGMHRPVLDLDLGAQLLPSSTPGHFHLYIDRPLTFDQYTSLLSVLADVGVIEPGFAKASIRRGYSAVRLPWIKKPAVAS